MRWVLVVFVLVGGVAATTQLWAVGGVAATTQLWAVGGAVATAQLWAVELSTEDESVARRVAGDLGMVVAGKVFSNVFLMRGDSDDDRNNENVDEKKSDKEKHEDKSSRLNHRLIVWSERQVGRRRASGSERANRAVPGSSSEALLRDSTGAGVRDYRGAGVRDSRGADVKHSSKDRDTYPHMGRVKQMSAEGDNQRQVRNIGGLDRTFPTSPWDFPKTRDPLRWRQWYLGPGAGMHLNVTGLWASGVRGGGVSVAILDDGVELTHLDLALNYDPAASWDLLDSDPDPTPVPWSRHGTQLAGIIAATHFNGMCGMGVAPWSGVGAVRMLGYAVWDATEAEALAYGRDHVDVYVAAWGPVDTGAVLEGPGVLASRALRESIALGRDGRGSIYVWASGNGGFVGDDCNADGYANSIYTLTVSGSTRAGRPPSYAETCAATFVSTYSGDADEELDPEDQVNGVVTTDTGGVCTESFRGSSVSAAMVAGACALALDANPNLRWRDMQHLMVRAATPHNPLPAQWKKNGAGISYSHYFGFGSLNAGRMVDMARKWKSAPPAFRCHMHAPHHNLTLVPDLPLVLSLTVSGCQVVQAEHIQVNASISARSRGQVEVSLESPSGTVSTLLPQRPLDLSPYGIYNHPLMTVHMWGEDPRGTWKLRVLYHGSSVIGPFGSKLLVTTPNMLHNWTLIIHGTEVSPARASPSHYYYSLEQLSRKHRHQNGTGNAQTSIKRVRNPKPMEERRVRVDVQHWNSTLAGGGASVHSYLYCRVRAPIPSAVSSINWYKSNGQMIENVVRRMSGSGAFSAKYPALLLVLESVHTGNFTCKVVYDNEIISQHLEVTGHSTIPEVTETTQVSVEGGNVSLSCNSLPPFLRGTWTREGKQVTPSARVTITEEKLTISSVERQDLGVYKCQVRSARLHYTHTAAVTLLLAQGPSTLITHYAITTHPPPPASTTLVESSCTSQWNTTPASADTAVWGLGGPGSRRCPLPYKALEGRCLLVAPGEPRSWQRARTQCRRHGGDLLVLQDAALMLALMQLFHSQG
ncbi:neuroendocrine convertase 2 [Procambarus clarkii]|uniref:neuroendocrine convertase 2 n=1 Tax=Procambarus clarkii TaxID=6728 RepID=UPI0037442B7D